jgi:hypothetical protein
MRDVPNDRRHNRRHSRIRTYLEVLKRTALELQFRFMTFQHDDELTRAD